MAFAEQLPESWLLYPDLHHHPGTSQSEAFIYGQAHSDLHDVPFLTK